MPAITVCSLHGYRSFGEDCYSVARGGELDGKAEQYSLSITASNRFHALLDDKDLLLARVKLEAN